MNTSFLTQFFSSYLAALLPDDFLGLTSMTAPSDRKGRELVFWLISVCG